ncbi:hypothetical protein MCUN1_000764 [Malassezia cuniculi]|uniref:Pre-mRNA-processing factor 17 n=1 Tax=Malassezia cuniculi TaxID=948313 RepID=A0AAF0EWG6_9BASI|nr:hypothetical protein MCUN1_000764 [Malassezia cuniculi]
MDALSAYRSDSESEPEHAHASDDEHIDQSDAFGLSREQQRQVVKDTGRADAGAGAVVQTAPQVNAVTRVEAPADELPEGVTQTWNATVESSAMSDFDFRNQQRTFDILGYARDPSQFAAGTGVGGSASAYVGDRSAAVRNQGATLAELRGGDRQTRTNARAMKKRRKGRDGDAAIVDGDGAYVGPWGGWEGEADANAAIALPPNIGPTAEEIAAAEDKAAARAQEMEQLERRKAAQQELGSERSIFHGRSMYDYQGRTYMHIPTDVGVNLRGDVGDEPCYIPQTCIHTFTGHTRGISALRLFPQSGHLLLSASMDTKVKLWDIYHQGNCLRTFLGHTKPLRDVFFNNDGTQFLSAAYDKQVKLWDTETGACLRAFGVGDVPNCVRFNPNEDKQHVFLVATNDKRIVQFDTRSGEITQEYTGHLGAVNTITFVDNNRRFVTTSDDKTLRVWDFDIPVVIKLVAEPTMYSLPTATLDPTGHWIAYQSMDSQVAIYSSQTFKNRRKAFRGHSVGGAACQVGFSPDGKFLSSGDGHGNVVFWDFYEGDFLDRLPAHDDVVIAHEWLPHETSKIVTGSWDGLIKLWT